MEWEIEGTSRETARVEDLEGMYLQRVAVRGRDVPTCQAKLLGQADPEGERSLRGRTEAGVQGHPRRREHWGPCLPEIWDGRADGDGVGKRGERCGVAERWK